MSDPTLSLSADKAVYVVGDTITLTALYTDTVTSTETVTITGTATDSQGTTISATTTVNVNSQVPETMDVEVTDGDARTYTQVQASQGEAVFTAVA